MTKEVIVYDKDNCPKCLHTEMQLKARGISFETKNIFDEENADILEWAQVTGNRTMPLVFVDGEFAWGDNRPDKVEELAKLVEQMDILGQLVLGVGAFALIVVVGSFIGIMMVVIEDMIEEQRQARERYKRRD